MALGIAEGLLLANYSFDALKKDTLKETALPLLQKVFFIGKSSKENGKVLEVALKAQEIIEGVYWTRDLINGNSEEVTPQFLAEAAKKLEKHFPSIHVTIRDRKWMKQEKMGLLLAVSQGSPVEPAFIVLSYTGAPKSEEQTVLIGKGITYDTGGLNMKQTGFMETMKSDMSGAATVLGTFLAVANRALPVNLVGIIPATENAVSATSYKPGDVFTSYSGKTVEIGNTDAEGRLVLADAITYAVKHIKPTRIIDFATLTGAIRIALGAEAIGLMANQDALADALISSGHTTYERLCRLPLYEEYREQLKSDIADINNVGSGKGAGAILAGIFLKEFVGDIPWAHCDIAGTAYSLEVRRYHPKFGVGIGVRLMADFLEQLR
jgi:leucyl aminopeptidase